jgi:hypothetical protein
MDAVLGFWDAIVEEYVGTGAVGQKAAEMSRGQRSSRIIIIIKRGGATGKREGLGIGRARHRRPQAVAQLGAWVVGGMFKCFFAPGNFANDTRLEAVVPGRCCRPLFPEQAIWGGKQESCHSFPDRRFREVGELWSETGNLPKFQNRVSVILGNLGWKHGLVLQFWIF